MVSGSIVSSRNRFKLLLDLNIKNEHVFQWEPVNMDIKETSNCMYCPGIHYRWAVKIDVTDTSSTDIKT